MNSFSRVTGGFLAIVVVVAALPALAGVQWADATYEEIVKRAKSENKHVFIDFYATWCGPCKKLDEVTYKDEKVIGFLNAMIPARWDAEKDEGLELAKRYNITAYPTLILLGPDGKEIDRYLGFVEPDGFIRMISDYQNGVGTVAYYEEQVKKDPKNAGAWKTLGMKHADAGRTDGAKIAFNTYLDLSPDIQGDEKAEVVYTLGEVNYRNKSYDDAIAIFERVTREFPGTEWHDQALVMGAQAYYKRGDNDKCIEWYSSYVDRHPDDPAALNSFAWFCASKKVGMEQALPYAQKAAELSNRDPGILDTLAELHYAMGNFDKAIEVGQEALKKDPEDTYLADQLAKFKKGKSEGKGK